MRVDACPHQPSNEVHDRVLTYLTYFHIGHIFIFDTFDIFSWANINVCPPLAGARAGPQSQP